MLKQIVEVRGLGILHQTSSSPLFNQVTLGFAENGRGKSTLACLLRSCSRGDVTEVTRRNTIGGTNQLTASLQFSDPTGVALLADGVWSATCPELIVFDTEFVHRNVYAGLDVSPDQRAKLLEFALGEEAVSAKGAHDKANTDLSAVNARLRDQTTKVSAKRGDLSLATYKGLQVPAQPEEDRKALQARLAAANNNAAIQAKVSPTQVPAPQFKADQLFQILNTTITDIATNAESLVKNHLAKSSAPGFEHWISQGSQYELGKECPYCGADASQSALIGAYQAHFNEEYKQLKAKTSGLEAQANQRLGDAVVDSLEQRFNTAQAQISGWADHLHLEPVSFNAEGMKKNLSDLRELIVPLARNKSLSPLEAVGTEADMVAAEAIWADAISHVVAANALISAACSKIEAFKQSVGGESSAAVSSQLARLNASVYRHSPPGVAELLELDDLTSQSKALSKTKEATRASLDSLMASNLATYMEEINRLLSEFGAQISIDNFTAGYRGAGGAPRSNYGIRVRGEPINLTGTEGTAFGNSLSEGDKRALAFAFFIARLRADPNLAQRIVVIDDPMCSLDRRRKSSTLRTLKTLAKQCTQLIVLAHDPFFLRELEEGLLKSPFKTLGRAGFKVDATSGNFSDFSALDLAQECKGAYQHNLETVLTFLSTGAGAAQAAPALRLVVEGSLHRQFPSLIARGMMLGQCISYVTDAPATSPLARLKPFKEELYAINEYASQFHHTEGEPAADVTNLDSGELRAFCERAVAFVFR